MPWMFLLWLMWCVQAIAAAAATTCIFFGAASFFALACHIEVFSPFWAFNMWRQVIDNIYAQLVISIFVSRLVQGSENSCQFCSVIRNQHLVEKTSKYLLSSWGVIWSLLERYFISKFVAMPPKQLNSLVLHLFEPSSRLFPDYFFGIILYMAFVPKVLQDHFSRHINPVITAKYLKCRD